MHELHYLPASAQHFNATVPRNAYNPERRQKEINLGNACQQTALNI